MPENDRERTDDGVSRRGQRRGVRCERNQPKAGLSCRRCQKRKIRCNGELPRCQSCAKVGVDCQDGESLKSRSLPRALCSRIEWLESLVRVRCPDIDLDCDGPQIVGGRSSYDGTEPGSEHIQNDLDSVESVRDVPPIQPELLVSTNAEGTNCGRRPNVAVTDNQAAALNTSAAPSNVGLSHEIGLISLGANRDPRYIGPSSGYVLCKLMLAASSRVGKVTKVADCSAAFVAPYLGELVVEAQGPISITKDQAVKLSQIYFDVVHIQYPFLHYPMFLRALRRFFEEDAQNHVVGFQTYMVLAISATIASRLHKIPLPGERYYMAAMRHFEKMQMDSSIQGLQCVLLLLVFAMYSPTIRLDVWSLNYQCLASVLDLGLQRAVTTSSGISQLQQEMRTRIFWVVYTLDRTIATMMGRPIGLRDEACDLRMPVDLPDAEIESEAVPSPSLGTPTHMSYAIHLFELAKLNSEIKYVANSVNPGVPNYAYPGVADIKVWLKDVLRRLDRWAVGVPTVPDANDYARTVLLLRYHSVRMLLLRPSPNIPRPDQESLEHCYSSAEESIRLFHALYKKNLLVHNWITFHSIVLSTITMLYCIFSVPNIAATLEVEVFNANVRASLSVLSAVGEHWSGAKRSRDILDELVEPISRWLVKNRRLEGSELTTGCASANHQDNFTSSDANSSILWPPLRSPLDGVFDGQFLSEQYGSTDCGDLDSVVLSLFDDFNAMIPSFT